MSEEILKALAAAGGHAHISVLVGMTKLPYDSAKNYLELLKKDNKVIYHSSVWHLKIFSNKPPIRRQHTSEKVLECLTDKRTLLDLQCMLPEVKQIQLQETLESLEKAGKIKSMVCYKAVQTNWNNKPTNPVQPIINKPPQPDQTSKPISVDPIFACQDIRYKEQDSNKRNANQPVNNRNNNNRSQGNKNQNQSITRTIYRDSPSSVQQGQPPPRHSQPNNSRFPPPNNPGFSNNPFQPPFSHNGAQAVRMPCTDENRPQGPPPPLQNMAPGPRGPPPGSRGPPPPTHEYRPPAPRPLIRLTGIDPYTNKAYGCAGTGYTGPPGQGPRPSQGPRPGFPVRHEAPVIRGHDLAIRQPAPVKNNAINHPAQDTYRRKNAGRGKSTGRGRSKDMDYSYHKEKKTLACTQKDPGEAAVKEAMRKESESGDQSMGSWHEDDPAFSSQKKGAHNEQKSSKHIILKKPDLSNLHVLIDSDDSSVGDDEMSLLDLPSLPSIPSNLDELQIEETPGDYIPLNDPSHPQKMLQEFNNAATSIAPVLNELNVPLSDCSFSKSSDQDLTNVSSAAVSNDTPQSEFSTITPGVTGIQNSPDYELELQQISSKLSTYNFGIQSDDSDEEEEEDPVSQVSSTTTPTPPHSQTPAKLRIGQLLRPVSVICQKEGLSHPVLVIKHRPDDFISPWSCVVTVEDTISGTGEGVSQSEAVQLATGGLRSALGSMAACRKFKQQTDFYAKMLHFMCKLRGFFPPVYHLLIKQNKVKLTVKIHGDLFHEKTSTTETADQTLSSSFEECCEKLYVPVPGLSTWNQEERDYKQALLEQCPGAAFSSRKVEESWWGDVTVQGMSYQAPKGFPKKWLSEQAAACVACFALNSPVFNWELPYVYIGRNTTFPKYRTS